MSRKITRRTAPKYGGALAAPLVLPGRLLLGRAKDNAGRSR